MRRSFAIAFLAIMPFALALTASATINPLIDGIEEDWQLVVSTPDPNVTCPQVTTLMQLDSNPASAAMFFNLNYRETPAFNPGGLQVKIQDSSQTYATANQGTAQLQTSNETITWTQRLSLSGGVVSYKVNSGNSTTWGSFGVAATDLAVSTPTSRTSLINYNPADSATNSGPGFGSNRLTSMTLLRVRYYQGTTLLSTDTTPRPVSL